MCDCAPVLAAYSQPAMSGFESAQWFVVCAVAAVGAAGWLYFTLMAKKQAELRLEAISIRDRFAGLSAEKRAALRDSYSLELEAVQAEIQDELASQRRLKGGFKDSLFRRLVGRLLGSAPVRLVRGHALEGGLRDWHPLSLRQRRLQLILEEFSKLERIEESRRMDLEMERQERELDEDGEGPFDEVQDAGSHPESNVGYGGEPSVSKVDLEGAACGLSPEKPGVVARRDADVVEDERPGPWVKYLPNGDIFIKNSDGTSKILAVGEFTPSGARRRR